MLELMRFPPRCFPRRCISKHAIITDRVGGRGNLIYVKMFMFINKISKLPRCLSKWKKKKRNLLERKNIIIIHDLYVTRKIYRIEYCSYDSSRRRIIIHLRKRKHGSSRKLWKRVKRRNWLISLAGSQTR